MNAKIKKILDSLLSVSDRAKEELEWSARDAITTFLSRPARIRPSFAARELKSLAKALKRASTAVERLGEQGMTFVWMSSGAQSGADEGDFRPHLEYLQRMARWAERAASMSAEFSQSTGDDKGGRSADENLRSLVVVLMHLFQEILGVRPTHTINPHTGLGDGVFDCFVKEGLIQFAPPGQAFEPHQVDSAIQRALESRDFEPFLPPRTANA
jgi:hypothetical protein